MLRRLFFMLLLVLIGRDIKAQYPFITSSLTEKDGLLSNYVLALAWDGNNHLWIGTDKGISIFDGHRFTHLTAVNGLKNTYATHFTYDTSTRLMTITTGDLKKYTSNGKNILPLIEKEVAVTVTQPHKTRSDTLIFLKDPHYGRADIIQKHFVWKTSTGSIQLALPDAMINQVSDIFFMTLSGVPTCMVIAGKTGIIWVVQATAQTLCVPSTSTQTLVINNVLDGPGNSWLFATMGQGIFSAK